MIKQFLILLFALLISLVSYSQNKSFKTFIPRDYDTLYDGVARGDLNKDGIEDVVLALYHKMENESPQKINPDSIQLRKLIILFGTKTGYEKVQESSSALLCKYCGGINGDPFAGININKDVLTINHYGGSTMRWSYTHKFRFQNGKFYLIGQTKMSFSATEHCDKLNDMAATDYDDENFVTGEFEIKKISEDCKLLENKKGRRAIQPLISLTNFNIDN